MGNKKGAYCYAPNPDPDDPDPDRPDPEGSSPIDYFAPFEELKYAAHASFSSCVFLCDSHAAQGRFFTQS